MKEKTVGAGKDGAKIKAAVFTALLLWIMVLSQMAVSFMYEKRMPLTEAFAAGDGAAVERCGSEIIARIRDDTGMSSTSDILEEIMESNGCGMYDLEDDSGRAVYTGEDVRVTVTAKRSDNSKDTYVHYVVESCRTPFYDYMSDECNWFAAQTRDYFDENGIEYASYDTACAVADGLLGERECREYAGDIMEKIGAKAVQEHYEDDYIVYGFARGLANPVVSDGDRINVQLLFCHDEIMGRTEIYIGTPILNL